MARDTSRLRSGVNVLLRADECGGNVWGSATVGGERFGATPIKLVPPVVAKVLHRREIGVVLGGAGQLVRPTAASSPLTQVNSKTVAKLVPAWSFSFGGEKQRGQESQPLVSNGRMFVTASYSRIFALNAKTGAKLWKYEHRLPEGIMP